ncbi:hypothetical protein Q3G72_032470 [Acer saccharum]|nr:hypothetical protein Q3G72_032470 [Acer saccharum]
MAGKEDFRIFVGGLSYGITERQLENEFNRFGKIIESQIMMERNTGRPRGFGFITYSDRRAMDDAIREMHGREFGDRIISVNKAQPKMGGGDDLDHGYRGGGYSSGGRGNYGGDKPAGQDDCFKCGRPGHWARDCPSAGGGRGGSGGTFSSRSRFGGAGGRGDYLGGGRDRYIDDRYDGGRYGDRDRYDSRDSKYGGRDRYGSDRYSPVGDRLPNHRLGASNRYPENGYGKDRGYERDGGPRGGSDRYGSGGPARDEGRGYRTRLRSWFSQPPRLPSSSSEMGLLSIIRKIKKKEKEMRILMVGLDNSGKTTIVLKINGEDTSVISPTLGFNIKTITYQKYTLNIWDVGGQRTIRSYWRNYFEQTDGLVWVVDSSDLRRLDDCKMELDNLLKEERLSGASLLILANKQDIKGALTPAEIAKVLNLEAMDRTRHWKIVGCSAYTGEGLLEGFDWLVQDIASRIYMLD